MRATEPTLLLTRPEAQSKAFLARCEALAGRSLAAVISPLMRIAPIGEVPNLDRYATILFTSANGVRSVQGRANLTGRVVATVGERAAGLATSSGADTQALGADVEGFLAASVGLKGPMLLCRGVHARGDLADRLRERGHKVDEAVVYDQVAVALSDEAQSLMTGSVPVVAPVFSPRSARLLAAAWKPEAPIGVVAISPAAAEAWDGPGVTDIASEPNAGCMAALTVARIGG